MMQILLYPFMVIALAGFLMSLAVHMAALAGWEAPSEAFGLHMGIFVVWIPATIASAAIRRKLHHTQGWRDQLAGCPLWMRAVAYGLFAYGFFNVFGVFLGTGSAMRIFSGHWMLFYWFAFATLYSIWHQP